MSCVTWPGYQAQCGDFNELPTDTQSIKHTKLHIPLHCRVDVLSMADVLEHMPWPRAALGRAAQMLRPGGILFLSMPNSDSVSWRYVVWCGVVWCE